MQFIVNSFDIIQGYWLIKQHFVKRQRESTIDIIAMKHCHTQYPANEVEIGQMFLK